MGGCPLRAPRVVCRWLQTPGYRQSPGSTPPSCGSAVGPWLRLDPASDLDLGPRHRFVTAFVIAAGPFQQIDLLLAKRWLRRIEPDLVWFAQNVLDRIAGQMICLPVLAAVAIVIARRRRSWRPIILAASAEVAFYLGVGGLKLLTARGVAYRHDPAFFSAGGFLAEGGSKGISFPSGHAAESILIYGMAAYLIARYTGGASRRAVRWLTAAVA